MADKYYYSLGLAGYEIRPIPDDNDHLLARFLVMGEETEHKTRKYKIQYTPGGRAFIRPDRRRVYLDKAYRAG